MGGRIPNTERRRRTRDALIRAARGLFAEKGFAQTSTDEIVTAAGVTRGALYHQFRDKTELFEAVLDQVESEIAAEIAREADGLTEPVEMLKRCAAAFLELCRREEFRRIALIDAPSVVGWQTWREIDARHALGLLRSVLSEAARRGQIAAESVGPISHLLLGAVSEAALALAQSPEDEAQRRRMVESLEWMIEGTLRAS